MKKIVVLSLCLFSFMVIGLGALKVSADTVDSKVTIELVGPAPKPKPSPKPDTLPDTGEKSSGSLMVLGGIVILSSLSYLHKQRRRDASK